MASATAPSGHCLRVDVGFRNRVRVQTNRPPLRAGETFWETGGDLIHYQDGNNRDDIPVRFLVTMLRDPEKPMLTLVDEDELAQRQDRRAQRTS